MWAHLRPSEAISSGVARDVRLHTLQRRRGGVHARDALCTPVERGDREAAGVGEAVQHTLEAQTVESEIKIIQKGNIEINLNTVPEIDSSVKETRLI